MRRPLRFLLIQLKKSVYKTDEGVRMKIRLISGSCYIAILVAFFCMKIFLPYGDFYFDALIYAFAILGTFEMLRATKEKTTKAERVIVYLFAVFCIPTCAVAEAFFTFGLHVVSVLFVIMSVALVSLLVIRHEETDMENLGAAFFSAVYPTLLLCLLVLSNHALELEGLAEVAFNSNLLVLFIFVISPLSDCFAFLVGFSLKPFFPRKFAPTISPNKTLVGAIGGLVGGIVAAVVLYLVYNATLGGFENVALWLPVYMAMGLVGAVATEFGDLLESAIKRKIGIKDMGNLMPGHGGVLDRIDGTMLVTVVVVLAYVLLAWIV
jgi:phosphatidate cytidylyltransferase